MCSLSLWIFDGSIVDIAWLSWQLSLNLDLVHEPSRPPFKVFIDSGDQRLWCSPWRAGCDWLTWVCSLPMFQSSALRCWPIVELRLANMSQCFAASGGKMSIFTNFTYQLRRKVSSDSRNRVNGVCCFASWLRLSRFDGFSRHGLGFVYVSMFGLHLTKIFKFSLNFPFFHPPSMTQRQTLMPCSTHHKLWFKS
jgi:hypothetical protein